MQVIVTRPADEAGRWVERLRQRGLQAEALPLLAIGPAPDMQAVLQTSRELQQWQAVMFVSANAVRGWFALRGGAPWPAGVRAWAPGPGTRDALEAAGVPPAQIDMPALDAEQFDSESLWARVQGTVPAGGRVLVVRGADGQGQGRGRDWLAQQLGRQGVAVDTIAAYARVAPVWSPQEQALAHAACTDGSCWLLSSSEAIAHLAQLLPGAPWHLARALTTHPRIAQAARNFGFGRVDETRPAFDDVVASIESAR